MSRCYVILPYAEEDDKSEQDGVFRSVVSAAARKAGFEDADIVRLNYDGDAQQIIKDCVEAIAGSDIVVVDITGGNANVLYALGVSHVFHRCGTVVIAREGSGLSADMKGMDVLEYSEEKLSVCVERLCETIRVRMKGKGTDNYVHGTLAGLPERLFDIMGINMDEMNTQIEELKEEIEELKEQIETLTEENAELKKRPAVAPAAASAGGHRSIREILSSTKDRLQYSGSAAISKLTSLADDDRWDDFLDHLVNVMEIGAPTSADLNTIVQICEKAGNRVLLQDVLEASLTLCPDDPTLIARLAKLYAGQPANKDKARSMIESAVGIRRDEEGRIVDINRNKVNHNSIARLFDSYNYMNDYEDLVEAGEFILKTVGQKDEDMIYRNILRAYINAGELESAKNYLDLVEANDTAVDFWIVSLYYDEAGDHVTAYKYLEKAMIADPEDLDYPRMLASTILNESIVRTDDETIQLAGRKQTQRSAAAFMYYLLQRNRNNKQVVSNLQAFASRGGQLDEYFTAALPFLTGDEEELPYETTDLTGLNYCLARVGEE